MAVKMIPEKTGDVKEKTKDWRRPVRSPMEMSRVSVFVAAVLQIRSALRPRSRGRTVTRLFKFGPDPNGSGSVPGGLFDPPGPLELTLEKS